MTQKGLIYCKTKQPTNQSFSNSNVGLSTDIEE